MQEYLKRKELICSNLLFEGSLTVGLQILKSLKMLPTSEDALVVGGVTPAGWVVVGLPNVEFNPPDAKLKLRIRVSLFESS